MWGGVEGGVGAEKRYCIVIYNMGINGGGGGCENGGKLEGGGGM